MPVLSGDLIRKQGNIDEASRDFTISLIAESWK